MAKRRNPGGGRKPNPNKKVMFSTRLEPQVMASLKEAAKKWPQGNVSTFAEFLIDRGLREREEEERDPELRALLYLIAQLAENITGLFHRSDKDGRLRRKRTWRSDRFYFRAFQIAVFSLLNALEEPPQRHTDEQRLKAAREVAEASPSPELARLIIDVHKSPGSYGAYTFMELWNRANRPDPLTGEERDLMRDHPDYLGNYFYRLPRAVAALKFKRGEIPLMKFES